MRRLRPPSPPGLPLLGHLPWFLSDKLGYLQDCQRRYGPVVRLSLGGPCWLLSDPADVRHILVDNPGNYRKSPRIVGPRGRRLWGDTLLSLQGEQQRQRRVELARLFHREALEDYLQLWFRQVEETLSSWSDGDEIELCSELDLLARQGILCMLFGRPHPELLNALEDRRKWLERGLSWRWPGADPSGPLRQACLTAPIGNQSLHWRSQELNLPVETRTQELSSLLVSGFEATSPWLIWSVFLLANHPLVQEELSGGQVSAEQVSKEALRLYPPTWLFVRQSVQSDKLASNYVIPAQTRVYLSQYLTHRLECVFSQPELFLPRRDYPDDPGAFFPFGRGPRRCPAQRLAQLQVTGFVQRLSEQFRVEALTESVRPVGGITLRPDRALWVRLHLRRKVTPLPCNLDFSVVVPSYNRPQAVRQLLRALLRQNIGRNRFEVILVDDCSSKPLDLLVAEYADRLQVTLLRLPRRHGPGPARQAGVEVARGLYLAFTDDDCLPDANWLEQMAQGLRSGPNSGIGGTTYNGLTDNLFSAASQSIIDSLYTHYNQPTDQASYFATNNVAFPREPFRQIGGVRRDWDLSGGEDRELCQRWRRSFPLKWSPSARVKHSHPLGPVSFLRQHFNYGRGGFHFSRQGGQLAGSSPSFLAQLLRRPLSQSPGWRGACILLLILMAQAATLAGYAWEWIFNAFGWQSTRSNPP